MLEGKTIIVTGAASGIGRAAASLFASDGAQVIIADRSEQAGYTLVDELTAAGCTVAFCQTDVSSPQAVQRLIEFAISRYKRLDGAFNNAGIEQKLKLIPDLASGDFDEVMSVNLHGVFLCMKYEIAAMRDSGGGAIVNTASVGGERGVPYGSEYIASKHGVIGLTRAASAEARDTRVRVNAVLPGLTLTPMVEQLIHAGDYSTFLKANGIEERHSIGRYGRPTDVARAVRWLLSDDSDFINGAMLPVDGGYLSR